MAFGALNLVCIGIMGEYVGRIYEQAKGRPLYLVRERVGEPSPDAANADSAEQGEGGAVAARIASS
jgi:hypothetical protein